MSAGLFTAGRYPAAFLPAGWRGERAAHVLRLASIGYTTSQADDPANTPYYPRIQGDIEVSASAINALGVGGRVTLGLADFEIADADDAMFAPIAMGTADGRRCTVRVVPVRSRRAGNFGTVLGSAPVAFQGVLQSVDHAQGRRARLSIADASQRLAVRLQPVLFTGTGGLAGPSTLAGRPVPICYGPVTNVTPVPLGDHDFGDGALPTFMVNGASVHAITAVRIRGVEQVLVGVAPGIGEARVWRTAGCFQIGSSADGAVTCDAQGDDTGGYIYSTAGVIRRLLQAHGAALANTDINASAFGQAEVDLPGAIGFYQGPEEITVAAAVERILAGCGAFLGGGRDGTLRLVDPLAQGEAQFVIAPGNIFALEPLPLPAALRALPWAVLVDWARNGTVMTDFSGAVSDDARAQFGAQARGPVRSESPAIYARVAQRRELRFPGLYAAEADAQNRAEQWRDFLEASPRLFRITTDRFLGQIELGDIGRFSYPSFSLGGGVGCVVLEWRELLAGRRLSLTVATVPWVTEPAPAAALPFFVLDSSKLS